MRALAEIGTIVVASLSAYKLLFHDKIIMPALRKRWDRLDRRKV